MYTGAPRRPSVYRSPAGPPHADLDHLGRSGQIWGPPAYENDTPPACGLHWPCVKPLQSSPGSKGNGRKHARAPFSAVRATRKLKVDGFSSSRGALHDPHHEKTTKATTSPRPLGGDRWTPAPRCIFHHFCKCDTSQGVTPRLNFRFDRFFELFGTSFITFASVTPI